MFASSSVMRIVAISAPWQLEREPGAFRLRTLEMHPSPMGLHDVAHDGEPEAGGPGVADSQVLAEALEDPFLLLGRDAGTGVVDGDPHQVTCGRTRDVDPAPGWRITKRVGDEIREGPGELGLVAVQHHVGSERA